jgi:hypothetical protein
MSNLIVLGFENEADAFEMRSRDKEEDLRRALEGASGAILGAEEGKTNNPMIRPNADWTAI